MCAVSLAKKGQGTYADSIPCLSTEHNGALLSYWKIFLYREGKFCRDLHEPIPAVPAYGKLINTCASSNNEPWGNAIHVNCLFLKFWLFSSALFIKFSYLSQDQKILCLSGVFQWLKSFPIINLALGLSPRTQL